MALNKERGFMTACLIKPKQTTWKVVSAFSSEIFYLLQKFTLTGID